MCFLITEIIYVVTAQAAGLWQLMRLRVVFSLRAMSTHLAYWCADKCTWSKSTRPNLRSEVSLMVEQMIAVRKQPVQFVGIVVNHFHFRLGN
jgi:hypothetical protein